MSTVVEISDNEDVDDCVIKSIVFVVDDEPESNLYHEICKENQLLADFIEKCLKLENSDGMLKVLKEDLLKQYYAADKVARESPKFQKNLRRANHLLQIDPRHKFTHIQDLCNILKILQVKKRVPFVTLSTNLIDTNRQSNELKRSNTERLDVITSTSKRVKSDSNNISPFSEIISSSFNDSCDTLEDSMSVDICSQQSSVTEDKLLIPKKDAPVVPTSAVKRIKLIENKITYYKKQISILDGLEVDDDSVNSPYLKSERLKTKIVSLYNERCQLIGSQRVKRKGIRLKLADGRPTGPTKALERFLNQNFNKDGEPSFPDFCDVVTCVTEANNKDDLGWTKAQIMHEASTLFTLCGRALQKRRQNREYRDLLYNIRLEDLEKDPADDDPELKAKLEENKRIAVKKESDILERFTMMQYLPSKSKSQKDSTTLGNKKINNIIEGDIKAAQEQGLINNNDNSTEHLVSKPNMNESEKRYNSLSGEVTDSNITNAVISNSNIESQTNRDALQGNNHMILNDCVLKTLGNETFTGSILLRNVNTEIDITEHCSYAKDYSNKIANKKVINNGAGHIIKPASNIENKDYGDNMISNEDNNLEKINITKNQILQLESIESQAKHKIDEDAIGMLKSLGKDFTVTVMIMNDS